MIEEGGMNMKRSFLAAALLAASTSAVADPGLFLGLAYTFSDSGSNGVGVSFKVLSTDKVHHGVVGAGVTYYPLDSSNPFGVDVGAGYLFDNAAVTAGWDFMHSPQIAVGYVNTDDGKSSSSYTPPAPPPPE